MLNPASSPHRTQETLAAETVGAPAGNPATVSVMPEPELAEPALAVDPTTILALVIAGIGLWLHRAARRNG